MDINLSTPWLIVLVVLVIWELVWKDVALWRASQHDRLAWFIAIFIINSAGLLPIIYLLLHRKDTYKGLDMKASHG